MKALIMKILSTPSRMTMRVVNVFLFCCFILLLPLALLDWWIICREFRKKGLPVPGFLE